MKPRNIIDLSGQIFGSWTVISMKERTSRQSVKWICKCSCGKTDNVSSANLKSGKSVQCRYCQRKSSINEKSVLWKGYKGISGTLWNRINTSAAKRKVEITVTIEEVWDLFVQQDGRCNLSGLPIEIPPTCSSLFAGNMTASLDRIDSTKGYIPGNLQWLHKDVNRIKTNMPQERFIEICTLISGRMAA